MSMNIFEVRSEDEGIGNLLFVVVKQDFTSDDEILKLLWIEAQEYNESTPIDKIESDYSRKRKNFKLSGVDTKDFKSRLKDIFSLFESYDQILEEFPGGSFSKIKEEMVKVYSGRVILLEDDCATYCAFISNGSSKALFSWCDVA
ncbi:hypothetical protein [Pseudoteredinibacter isoporae]|uniref:hypothetical protein n=1 Tax=Pseudoteredinibacter isoporae TaxID=570281 RepID=UPI00310C3E42